MSDPARAWTAATIAAAVIVATVAVIIVLGRPSPPHLPTLAEHPTPQHEGTLPYLRADGDGTCVVLVALSDGARDELACVDETLRQVALSDDGRSVIATGSHTPGRLVVTVDIADRTVDERVVDHGDVPDEVGGRHYAPAQQAVRTDGTRATINDDLLTVIDDADRIVAERELSGGRGYRLRRVEWTADEQRILVYDNADRILVFDEEAGTPRVVTDDADHS